MEETTQQIIQKQPFPIKTKIAAWWITIIGGLCFMTSIWLIFIKVPPEGRVIGTPGFGWFLFFLTPLIAVVVSLLIPGIMILYLKKRLGWWLATESLSIWTILIFGYNVLFVINNLTYLPLRSLILFPLLTTLIAIIPLILLTLDRKNFFKIAS